MVTTLKAVIMVNVVSTCRGARASVLPCNDGLDTHAAPCPLYEGKNQDDKCDLGQSGALLPSTTLHLSPQSFTMATQHVLSSISPAKRLALLLYVVVSQCK